MGPALLLAATLSWLSPLDSKFTVNGLPWLAENKGELIRLPHRLEAEIPKPVWNLGLSPSGGRIRFRTNSRHCHACSPANACAIYWPTKSG